MEEQQHDTKIIEDIMDTTYEEVVPHTVQLMYIVHWERWANT